MKKRYFSVKNDFKLGVFSKILLSVGTFLVFSSILLYFVPLVENNKELADILIAFSILSIGVGLILLFISNQFAKLAKIAEDIENFEDDL